MREGGQTLTIPTPLSADNHYGRTPSSLPRKAVVSSSKSLLLLLLVVVGYQSSVGASPGALTDDIGTFKTMLVQKFDEKQFTELEAIERELRSSKARFAGGDWKLYHFYDILSAAHVIEDAPIESDWLTVLSGLKEWQKHSPASAVPATLLADAYASYAWFARGSGRAATVSEAKWSQFKDRLNQGAFFLNASKRLSGDTNPQWHTTALVIARGLSWPRDRADALVKEAFAIEPLYQHVYSVMTIYLLPQWFGEPGDWERFAQETADRIGGTEGSAVYNHIALYMSNARIHGNTQFFEQNDVKWRKMQWSYADREKLYGAGIQPLNAMLRLAGGAKDKAAARDFLKQIGEHWDPWVWRRRQNFDEFKAWVDAE